MSHYLVRQIGVTPNIEVKSETEVVDGGGDRGWLDHLVLRSRVTEVDETVPADGLFLMIGADPLTGWLPAGISRDERGFLLTGADLPATAGHSRAPRSGSRRACRGSSRSATSATAR